MSGLPPDDEVAAPAIEGSMALLAARDPGAEFTRTRSTPAAAFRAARRTYLQCRRLDMQALAAELDVSRATLYRWTGSREQLLADVLWSLSDDIFERAKADHPEHTGPERLRDLPPARRRARHGAAPAGVPPPGNTRRPQDPHLARRRRPATHRPRLAQLYREEQECGAFHPAPTSPASLTPSPASPKASSTTTRSPRSNPTSNAPPQSSPSC